MRATAAILLCLFASSVGAFQPRTGIWNNLVEGGSGFNIEIQNGVLVATYFSYKTNGDSEWYLAAGPMTNSQRNFTGTLDKYRGGQCVGCAHTTPTVIGNDGLLTINFTSETTAVATLGGRTMAITPYSFGFAPPPQGLFGEWVFVYDIITTFADRFTFTSVEPGTSDGNGVAVDNVRIAGCEYQVSGTLAGKVVCADADSAGFLTQGYVFTLGIDETFDGSYVTTSGSLYPMKGFRIAGSSGNRKSAAVEGATLDDAKAAQDKAAVTTKASSALMAAFHAIASRVSAAQ